MALQSVKVDARGRITIPEEIRTQLEINPGDLVYVKIDHDSFSVYPATRIRITVSEEKV